MKLNKLLFFSTILLAATSCKKVLDIKETDLIAGDNVLTTVTFAEQAVIGAYGVLGTEMGIQLNSVLADEVKTAGEFYVAGTTHEWQYTASDVGIRDNYTAITPNYQIIDRVNRVLAALPKTDSTKAGDNTKRIRLKGEALFLRAYAHFELFRYYCGNYDANGLGMPYMTVSSSQLQARIKMGPYFQQMVDDITEAKTLLPTSLSDKNRATVAAANALHARIALYMRDWANAETYSTAYINALPLSPRASFADIWKDANTNEVAFQLIRTASVGGRIGSIYRNTSANASNIGAVVWKPTDKLWDSYDQVNDIRFTAYMKNEPLLLAPRQSRIIIKYEGKPAAGATNVYGSTNENLNNAKVYRTGEMYLIRAEARAELGKFTGSNSAESDLNELRAARISGYTPVTFASKEDAINAVMLERFKELAFEGHRFWDLKRRNLPVSRNPIEAPTATSATLPAGNFRFVLPIPLTEIQANRLMEQNPGYER